MKIKYIDIEKYKYMLAEDVEYQSEIRPPAGFATEQFGMDANGLITVRKGFMWDGASGPALDTDTVMPASMFHDVLYRSIRMGLLPMEPFRKQADILYRDMAIADGASRVRMYLHYIELRRHGEDAATADGPEVTVREAP